MDDILVYLKYTCDLFSCTWPKTKALEDELAIDTLQATVIFEALSHTMSIVCHRVIVELLFKILYLIIAVVKLSIASKAQVTAACVQDSQHFDFSQRRLLFLHRFIYFNERC